MRKTTKKALALGLAVSAIGGIGLISSSASADPQQYTALVGVGSDTTQDVINGMAGFANGKNYTPINTGSPDYVQLISFDANKTGATDTCITPKIGAPTFTRPNGSGAGQKALYAASGESTAGWTGSSIGSLAPCSTGSSVGTVTAGTVSGTTATLTFAAAHGLTAGKAVTLSGFSPSGWNGSFAVTGAPTTTSITFSIASGTANATTLGTAKTVKAVDISGTVDFARSSSLSSSTGTKVVFIPFARDAVSYAGYRPGGGTVVTSFSKAQLTAIFNTATRTTVADPDGGGNITIIPCGIQTGSGTYSFWNTALGNSSTVENTATDQCNQALAAGRAQENEGPALSARGDALLACPGSGGGSTCGALTGQKIQVVIGFSVGAFVAKSNGNADPAPGTSVKIGSITDVDTGNSPVTSNTVGGVTTLSPSTAFYANTTFGRNIYNVVAKDNLATAGNAYNKMFVGTTSAVCAATSTIQAFGFAPLSPTDTDTTQRCGDTSRERAWATGVA